MTVEFSESNILISDNNGYDASWINWYFLTKIFFDII